MNSEVFEKSHIESPSATKLASLKLFSYSREKGTCWDRVELIGSRLPLEQRGATTRMD